VILARVHFPIVARGLGKSDPVPDNSTTAGRKLNRRAETIVSRDVIGARIGPGSGTGAQSPSPESSIKPKAGCGHVLCT